LASERVKTEHGDVDSTEGFREGKRCWKALPKTRPRSTITGKKESQEMSSLPRKKGEGEDECKDFRKEYRWKRIQDIREWVWTSTKLSGRRQDQGKIEQVMEGDKEGEGQTEMTQGERDEQVKHSEEKEKNACKKKRSLRKGRAQRHRV